MIKCQLFEPILNIVIETMPKDNLLNSAALEFFDYIRRQSVKPAIIHIVEGYRERLAEITYVDLFDTLILRYDQMHEAVQMQNNAAEEEARKSFSNGSRRWGGPRDLDAEEEEYFNTSDDEDNRSQESSSTVSTKPLVDYNDDEDMGPFSPKHDEEPAERPETPTPGSFSGRRSRTPPTPRTSPDPVKPSSEKRRREEDDDDELGRLARGKKRSMSVSSTATIGSTTSVTSTSSTTSTATLAGRKRSSNTTATSAPPQKKIAINLKTSSTVSKLVMANTPSPTTPTSMSTLESTNGREEEEEEEEGKEEEKKEEDVKSKAQEEQKEEKSDIAKAEEVPKVEVKEVEGEGDPPGGGTTEAASVEASA